MAIRIGVPGLPLCCKGKGMDKGLKWLADHGLHEEIQFSRKIYMDSKAAKETRELAGNLGIKLSVHAPYYINLCNPAKLKVSMQRILESARRAEEMGADIVVFHPGFYTNNKAKDFEAVKKACVEMSKKTGVPLGIETMGRQKQFGTLEENIRIASEVNNCVPVVDFAHIYTRSNGKVNFGAVLDKVKRFKPLHTHFTCAEFSNGNERRHLPLAAKKPDFKLLITEIKKRKLDITIICESPILEVDALKIKRFVEGQS